MSKKSLIASKYIFIIIVLILNVLLIFVNSFFLSLFETKAQITEKAEKIINTINPFSNDRTLEVNLLEINTLNTFLEVKILEEDKAKLKQENIENILDLIFFIEKIQNDDIYYNLFLKYKNSYLKKIEIKKEYIILDFEKNEDYFFYNFLNLNEEKLYLYYLKKEEND